MKIYLLDKNIICEPIKKNPSEKVIEKLAENLEYSCISAFTWAETLAGVKTLKEVKQKNALSEYFVENVQKQYEVLPFDSNAASIYSDLVERLNEKEISAEKLDLLLASIAISNNLILVSKNPAAFEAIASNSTLMLENWFEE